jgi:opine dehydrogenase
MTRAVVLGGGNGAHAAVVDLSLKGFEVAWWRRDDAQLPADGRVRYSGILGEGSVEVALCTADLAAALRDAALVVAPLPATAQPELLDRLAPLLEAAQVVAWTPGTFGTWLGARRRPDVVFMETGTLPYLARVTAPATVSIPVVATRLPVGSIPGSGELADAAHGLFARAYPSAVRVRDGFDAALTNWGPVLHPPLVVQNLGAIETLEDRFDIHSEGTSAGVVRTILAVDDERVSLREALGVPGEHWPIRTHYEQSPEGMYGSEAKERLVASGLWRESLHTRHRYVTEDIMCGLVLNASIGRLAGCPMPVSEALLALAAPSLELDPWQDGRTAAAVGVHELDGVIRAAQEGLA